MNWKNNILPTFANNKTHKTLVYSHEYFKHTLNVPDRPGGVDMNIQCLSLCCCVTMSMHLGHQLFSPQNILGERTNTHPSSGECIAKRAPSGKIYTLFVATQTMLQYWYIHECVLFLPNVRYMCEVCKHGKHTTLHSDSGDKTQTHSETNIWGSMATNCGWRIGK